MSRRARSSELRFAHFSVVSFPAKSYVLVDADKEQTKSGVGLHAPWGFFCRHARKNPIARNLPPA